MRIMFSKTFWTKKEYYTKINVGVIVRTADKKNVLCKGDTTNWSWNFYAISENIKDNIRVYDIKNWPEANNEASRIKRN